LALFSKFSKIFYSLNSTSAFMDYKISVLSPKFDSVYKLGGWGTTNPQTG